jgi:hypothetical protein
MASPYFFGIEIFLIGALLDGIRLIGAAFTGAGFGGMPSHLPAH